MSIFGWRKRQIADKVDKDINDTELPEPKVTPVMPKVVAPRDTANDDAVYTIGINDTGNIQLRLNGNGYGATTLTMNEAAVRTLIRQLEAALPEQDEE